MQTYSVQIENCAEGQERIGETIEDALNEECRPENPDRSIRVTMLGEPE